MLQYIEWSALYVHSMNPSLCGAGQAGHFLGKDDSTLAIYINYLSMLGRKTSLVGGRLPLRKYVTCVLTV